MPEQQMVWDVYRLSRTGPYSAGSRRSRMGASARIRIEVHEKDGAPIAKRRELRTLLQQAIEQMDKSLSAMELDVHVEMMLTGCRKKKDPKPRSHPSAPSTR